MSLSVLRPYLTYNSATPNNVLSEKATFARLITYFGNFGLGNLVTLVVWISVQCFPFARQKWKINILLSNIFVTSLPKTTQNEVTKMGWKAQKCPKITSAK